MSEFLRETLLNIIETDHVQCGEASALARKALAAMDSESECLPLDYLQGHKDGLEWAAQLAEANHPDTGDWLYDDPIELVKAIRKGPDMPPSQPVADSEPVIVVGDDGGDALSYRRLIQSFEPGTKLYRHAQPAPVSYSDFEEFWSAYIHPLAQDDELKDFSWGIWNACVSNSQPAPVVPDGYVMVPKEMTDEIGEAIAMQANCCGGIALDIYDAMLAAAPQSPGGDHATVPGKWIPVSEQKPDCWCLTCRPVTLNDMRFVVCPDCGNKRCPRANDHRDACTGSNEPGQEGSVYPAAQQEVKGE
ncbi:DUF551 domain-containing protein [Klebsiella pneumoniae]|uniref:DUF551 domain-containing protein n=1 Tax=Klebsiella pneumoniae TaxID=573 RepID=A0A6B2IZ04_KLEPN|nr:DUF551 domain-containing protein [Klebsiella pneumoniae]NDR63369.1 DUF551 domain-containing protein [Klebsiella pneumoniae]NDR83945.1 DUF551 domain-containing protein [Klebsiella pneumoniae]NDR99597.1 DUF551 domain-containing protein [Klebsiella pneumoniae]NDS06255.1 DUF551 domain-containing protein [Klebsiella pneumoniae]NDS29174.1 DUF551 domain-containing protein [Klebsiella pneumoniae]